VPNLSITSRDFCTAVRSVLYRDHLRLRGEWRTEQARLAAATRSAQGEAKEAALALQATRGLVEQLRSGSQVCVRLQPDPPLT
jgi:hypothetical protein